MAKSGAKARLLQAMEGSRLVTIGEAAEIMASTRKEAARYLNRGVRDGWWRAAGVRHAAGDDRRSQRRFGLDAAALQSYAESTAQPSPMALEGVRLNRRIGAMLGAITDLAGIKARCEVNEDTECWIWRFSVAGGAKVPHAHIGGKNLSMVRVAYEFSRGRPVQKNHIVWRTCCQKLCLNPEHMRQGTRSHQGQWVREQGTMRGDLKRIKACRAGAATRTKVTTEIARQIMLSDRPYADWARELGVSTHAVKRAVIKRVEGAPNSSVFAWRPAA